MAGSRSSRCKDTDYLNIYLNGVLMEYPRIDYGFIGDTHLFTSETNLVNPDYYWTLDQPWPSAPTLGTNSSYAYTFDDTKHRLWLFAKSEESGCGIGKYITVKSKGQYECPVKCKSESVNIPAGKVTRLVSDTGTQYLIPGNNILPCAYNTEEAIVVAQNIAQTIRDHAKCEVTGVSVSCFSNFSTPNCMTIKITNSPIKFRYLITDKGTFSFNTQNC